MLPRGAERRTQAGRLISASVRSSLLLSSLLPSTGDASKDPSESLHPSAPAAARPAAAPHCDRVLRSAI